MPLFGSKENDESRETGRDSELASLQWRLRRAEQEHARFVQFVREFPQLTRELTSTVSLRELPNLLLQVLMRAFAPVSAAVAVRRSAAGVGDDRPHRFVVAAARGLSTRQEVVTGRGALGFAAEVQRVLDRSDLEQLPALTRRDVRKEGLADFDPDIVAPMVVGGETLGVVGIGGVTQDASHPKEMLRLICQTASFKLQSLEDYYTVRTAANLDGLTQILNKRAILQRLGELVFEAETRDKLLSIFLFDIDSFKLYNDRNGHVAGDALLRELAQLIQSMTRRENLFGRFGGEEFLLILVDAGAATTRSVANRMRERIAQHPFPHASEQPFGHISVSGGIATFPRDGRSSTELLKRADEALYRAKRDGRNRVYQPGA